MKIPTYLDRMYAAGDLTNPITDHDYIFKVIDAMREETKELREALAAPVVAEGLAKKVVDYVYARVLHHDQEALIAGVEEIVAAHPVAGLPAAYYSRDSDNFYDCVSGKGMGTEFHTKWRSRAMEFPVEPTDVRAAEPAAPAAACEAVHQLANDHKPSGWTDVTQEEFDAHTVTTWRKKRILYTTPAITKDPE